MKIEIAGIFTSSLPIKLSITVDGPWLFNQLRSDEAYGTPAALLVPGLAYGGNPSADFICPNCPCRVRQYQPRRRLNRASAYTGGRRHTPNGNNRLTGRAIDLCGVLHMIKQLFPTVALLVPAFAYGGNPSADLSVQVVPSVTRSCSPSGPGGSRRPRILECALMMTILDGSQLPDGTHSTVLTALLDIYFGLLELSP